MKIDDLQDIVSSAQELHDLLGEPSLLSANKVIHHLDEHVRHFLSLSPFVTISTADRDGHCDASPRGDAPGFVHVLDEKRLVIPERPGNKRIDSIRNILANPRIGLLFLIPGLNETLRINGRAVVVRDADLLAKMAVNGRSPLFGIVVEVEECFLQCAKALMRSKIWKPETWLAREQLPNPAQILADHVKLPGVTEEKVVVMLEESYTKRYY
ncbi:pyridoxamine 5'-phosphate oxidase family protein [Tumebacillus sp. DT12]|uniref:Pyridoxamine 5'-phosphate oxidase family protein n=1 Tax=Tumebacillus lacus TaxID=2995335 RepID=A0ABT3X5S9_9BACL|nr:pyridoxamine 5'-phosphate oxidase family protein [Tumebacillus lacus]MCX7571207.1 pyridoxamine 5'-phosphate oxidase family protein [Tumebacillus lacus]